MISEAQFDELQAKRRQARAALSQARDNVDYTRLKAPYEGTVARTEVENFQFVQAKEPILYLQGDDNIDIEFAVSERFFTNLTFTAPMEESIMDHTTNGFVPVDRAVRMWMHDNPQQVKDWLQVRNAIEMP